MATGSGTGADRLAVSRLRKELGAFHATVAGGAKPHFRVSSDEWNMLNWSYLLEGPAGTPYEGGWYWGRLRFPENYPLAPPSVIMCTPSGRFQTEVRICLSISDFHPENWKPAWGFATVLEGLHTFMGENTHTYGAVDVATASDEERRRLATDSAAWNLDQAEFRSAFPDFEAPQSTENSSAAGQVDTLTEDTAAADPDQQPANDDLDSELEATPPELTCGICAKLLLEPVSVTCGHTFCRTCLDEAVRALPEDDTASHLCATCQTPLLAGSGGRVNIVIKGLIAQQCPRALAARQRELEAKLAASRTSAGEVERRIVAPQQGGALAPLLRVDVLPFPGSHTQIDLTAQEVLSVEHALREGGRRVGLLSEEIPQANHSSGVDDVSDVFGCCAEVEHLSRAREGRPSASVRLVGKFRFRLDGVPRRHGADGIQLGRLEAISDDLLDAAELAPAHASASSRSSALDVAQACVALVEHHLVDVGDAGRHAFQAERGRAPTAQRDGTISAAALEELSFWLAAAVVVNGERRKLWMLSTDTRARLEDCKSVLSGPCGQVALNLPGAGSWMNAGKSAAGNFVLFAVIILLFVLKATGLLNI